MHILKKLNTEYINEIFTQYLAEEGQDLNEKLSELFETFDDHQNYNETLIKVAALNKIYSTGILNIKPIANMLVDRLGHIDYSLFSMVDFVRLVDQIKQTNYGTKKNPKPRNNLSFASKYVHFLSGRKTPIIDTYIWIMIQGYLHQYHDLYMKRTIPKTYGKFHQDFISFKKMINLEHISNYQLDKVLWYLGKRRYDYYKVKGYTRSQCLKRVRDELDL